MKRIFPFLLLAARLTATPDLPAADKAAAPEFPVVFSETFDSGLAGWTPRDTGKWETTATTNPNLNLVEFDGVVLRAEAAR